MNYRQELTENLLPFWLDHAIDTVNGGIFTQLDKEGNIYKDVNLGRGELDLHTAVNNDFYGEPDSPISDDIKVSVIKSFNKNKNKDRER